MDANCIIATVFMFREVNLYNVRILYAIVNRAAIWLTGNVESSLAFMYKSAKGYCRPNK